MATDADVRDLADAVRDLAMAHDRSRQDRVEMRQEGKERGKEVVEAVNAAVAKLGGSIDANTKAVDELRRTKAGAPWSMVYFGLAFNALITVFVIAIYVNSKGDDAAAAAKVATELVPDVPGLPAAPDPGTTGAEDSPHE